MAVQRMQQRRDNSAAWASHNPVLASGEIGYDTDTRLIKIGDGETTWTDLPWALAQTAGTAVTEGILGTVYVRPDGDDASSGLSWAEAKATIAAAIAATGQGRIQLSAGIHVLAGPVTLDVSRQQLYGTLGTRIDARHISSGTAFNVTAVGYPGYDRAWVVLKDFELVGPGPDTSSVGMAFDAEGDLGRVSGYALQSVMVHDFGTGIEFRDRTWGSKWYSCSSHNNGVGVRHQNPAINSGERHTFVGGGIFNNGLGVEANCPSGSLMLIGMSLDYNRQHVDCQGGHITCVACHIEGNAATYAGGYPMHLAGEGTLLVSGGRITGGTGAGTTPAYLLNESTGGGAVFHGVAMDSQRFASGYFSEGPGYTEIDILAPTNNTNTTMVSQAANLLADGGFEASQIVDTWFIQADGAPVVDPQNGLNIDLSLDTGQHHSGAQSLRLTKSFGAGSSAMAALAIPLPKPGALMGLQGWYAKPGTGNGNIWIAFGYGVLGRNATGVPTVLKVATGPAGSTQVNVANAAVPWTRYQMPSGSSRRPPAWCTHLIVTFNLTGVPGGTSLSLDDWEATSGI
jgi:hypothetical protein